MSAADVLRLLRGMAQRASLMRRNYSEACVLVDRMIRQRDEARAEVDRLKAKLEKAYTLIGEHVLRDIGIEPPAPVRVIYRDPSGARWKDLGDGRVLLIEYKLEYALNAVPADKATVEQSFGPLVPEVPASPGAGA